LKARQILRFFMGFGLPYALTNPKKAT